MGKNWVAILILIATVALAIIAVITAIKLYQIGKEPVAPTVPAPAPAVEPEPTPVSECTLEFTITKPTPTPTSTPTPTPIPTPTLTPTPTPSPTPTPTPTPACTGECVEIKIYDENWNVITDFSTFQIDQTIHFAVRGITDCSAGFTKGRFRINEAASSDWCTGAGNSIVDNWCEATNKHLDEYEYYYVSYVIPSAGTYKVESMVYCPDIGWR